MHRNHEGILAVWNLWLDEEHSHFCQVFMWETGDLFREANKDVSGDCYGRCLCNWIESKETGEHKSGRKFGEIHLVIKAISAGYVAHELQHLVGYWVRFMKLDLEKDDETISDFCEKVTNDFWSMFYQVCEVES